MRLVVLISAMAALLGGVSADATEVFFLKIPGIPGDVTQLGEVGLINVNYFSEGFKNAKLSTQGLVPESTATCLEFSVSKPLDATSPRITQAVVNEQPFHQIQLFAATAGEHQRLYLSFVFTNAVITSIQFGGDGTTQARSEYLTIKPSSVTVTSYTEAADGSQGTPSSTTIDCRN